MVREGRGDLADLRADAPISSNNIIVEYLATYQMMVYYFAKADQWHNINEYLAMSKLPCSPAAIGEICYGFGKREISKAAFLKVKDADDKINLLIDYEFWEDAVKQAFTHKRQDDYIPRLQAEGGAIVDKYIRQAVQQQQLK